MNITPNQIIRVESDYSRMVKESVKVEFINDTMYVYGSELAVLRLHYKMTTGRIGYSENLSTWFYAKDMN